MGKEDIINYVMTTPGNPNRAVLSGMLDGVDEDKRELIIHVPQLKTFYRTAPQGGDDRIYSHTNSSVELFNKLFSFGISNDYSGDYVDVELDGELVFSHEKLIIVENTDYANFDAVVGIKNIKDTEALDKGLNLGIILRGAKGWKNQYGNFQELWPNPYAAFYTLAQVLINVNVYDSSKTYDLKVYLLPKEEA